MQVLGATNEQIKQAAVKIGVTIHNLRLVRHGIRLTLKPKGPKYARISGSKAHEVCWHGERDYLVALLALNPRIRVRETLAHTTNTHLASKGACMCHTTGID